MTVTVVNNASEFVSALVASVGGDTIELAAGADFTGTMNVPSAGMTKGSFVTVTNEDESDPGRMLDCHVILNSFRRVAFIGIRWQGTLVESTKSGVQYPLSDECLRINGGSDFLMTDNWFDFFRDVPLRLQRPGARFEFAYNRWSRIGIDPVRSFGATVDHYWHHNAFVDARIDAARRNESVRHPDAMQIRAEISDIDAGVRHQNLRIEDNLFDDPSGYQKQIYLANQSGHVGVGWVGSKIKRNQISGSRWTGININGSLSTEIDGNRMRWTNTGVKEKPTITAEQPCSGSITNNVLPRAISYLGGAAASQFTLSGNVISETANPSGWVELVDGVNVGPRAGATGPSKPPAMTEEWANPPTNTIGKDGRIAVAVEAFGTTGRYTGVAVIPTASVAAAAMATNPLIAYAPITNLEWTRPGLSGWRPFRVANPAVNDLGWRRYEMMALPGDELSVWSTGPDETMSGISLRYIQAGLASDGSPYTGSFTGEPSETAAIPALEAADWEAVAVVPDALLPGRSTWRFKITGVSYTGAQWAIDGETPAIARPVVAVGLDGLDAILELRPEVQGGQDHTVGYLGAADDTLTIRVRYSVDDAFGPWSDDAKSFTGPEEPALPGVLDDWALGDLLIDEDDDPLCVGGVQSVIAGPDIPPAPEPEFDPVFLDGGTIVLTMPASPPPGTIDQVAMYNGAIYPLPRDNPTVSFPQVSGEEFVYACGVTADGQSGALGFWPVD